MLALPHAVDGFSQGLLHTEADFDRMATKVAEQAQPWYSGYQALISEGYAQLGTDPRPLETVIRGGEGQNVAQMYIDIQRAYLLAVRWKVTGDTAYADKAVQFLNAWQYTMTTLTGNADRFLAAGIYGYEWANVAEIMRTYSGWSATDAENFGNWLVTHYYQKNHDFLVNHNGAAITNYWANWDLCNIASMLAIGVYTDSQAIYDEGLDYFYDGGGNGSIDRYVYHVHDGNLGQWQESGRDQGHTTFGVSLVGPIMQMVWNQGLDLFSYDNNRFLAGAEYVAKYNLGYDVPFEQYSWGTGQSGAWQTHTVVSNAGRGNGRPGYELVYQHYANVKGIDAPWTQQRVDSHFPEGWDRGGDEFGFGTLTYTLDPYPAELSKPSGLTAVNYEGTVKLNWWGAVYADSYNIYRANSESGPYTQIASGITDLLNYTDFGMPAGEYFYKVTGVIDGNETDASNIVEIDTTPAMIVHLEFDETNGTTAADSTGNGAEGFLNNGASWTAGNSGNAVNLSGSNQYVSLPEDVTEDLSDFTIAAWVKLDSVSTWARIFDFGDSNGRYLFLTPRANSGNVRFAVATNYGYNEDIIEGDAALPSNQWVHVTVTLAGKVGRLYINGQLVGTNAAMNLNPFQVGGTSNNWIGRSQYPDPYLDGQVDDFRIYNGALSTGEIFELATGLTAPTVLPQPTVVSATAVPSGLIDLSWNGARGATYSVKRGTQDGGPYFTVATGLTSPSYSDTGLTAGTTYYYVVTNDNLGGQSDPSDQVSDTALPPLPGIPAELSAGAVSTTEIALHWTAASDAASYTIKRATTSGGSHSILETGVTDTSYSDTGLSTGETYYYVVSAVNAAGESADSTEAFATVTSLTLRLKFDETSGSVAQDSSGNGWDGALVNGPLWNIARIENGVRLDGSDDYVQLRAGVTTGLTDYTIATWVNFDTISNWTRVFDFGTGTSTYMFLTPQNGANGRLRFAISTNGGLGEQQINTNTTFTVRRWYHVAVTWSGNTGILYVNGTEEGRNSAMTLNPSSLGTTTQNYIGKSQYPDPYLDGTVDDFRIINRALTPSEVSQLAYAPTQLGDYDLDGSVTGMDFLAWQRQYQRAVPVFTGADGDGTGKVDQDDLQVWDDYYGSGVAALSAGLLAPSELQEPQLAAIQVSSDNAIATDLALDRRAGTNVDRGMWFLTIENRDSSSSKAEAVAPEPFEPVHESANARTESLTPCKSAARQRRTTRRDLLHGNPAKQSTLSSERESESRESAEAIDQDLAF